ncbi:uncharacterized protein BDZ99DRAFT_226210 [Mytilinidion resinicola]|uniref:Uncharacterized protein n=1 Tax=Mytilinidion resinicola TaxID=574789 RepID=A0A6A6Z0P7_9PEZI|nr:uncharacterized protein BDZ99DRAFT_226210 [Mytilinidion resinicola]KAF2813844.1 hypothetical protein BDZ99DRAFT_226210 [Mytilinidion resinicola]
MRSARLIPLFILPLVIPAAEPDADSDHLRRVHGPIQVPLAKPKILEAIKGSHYTRHQVRDLKEEIWAMYLNQNKLASRQESFERWIPVLSKKVQKSFLSTLREPEPECA